MTSCKHHGICPITPSVDSKLTHTPDRPLIRIKRKGRPFATCTICHATPCESPVEHTRQKRETELKCPKVSLACALPAGWQIFVLEEEMLTGLVLMV